jgi:hypothetical protein
MRCGYHDAVGKECKERRENACSRDTVLIDHLVVTTHSLPTTFYRSPSGKGRAYLAIPWVFLFLFDPASAFLAVHICK